MLTLFFSPRRRQLFHAAQNLYSLAVTQARQDKFYAEWQLPDTVDGRFDAIVLHVGLLVLSLRQTGDSNAPRLCQYLFDAMFRDMDRSLREMGVGDLGVPRRIRAMMQAFNGRIQNYASTLHDTDALAAVVRRNLYREKPVPQTLCAVWADYIQTQYRHLSPYDFSAFVMGDITWA
jgi:cytochrome b pre-mRNA-processing protein 3